MWILNRVQYSIGYNIKVSGGFEIYSIKVSGGFEITNSKCEKLLCVKFDRNLTFDDNISSNCEKVCKN